LSSQGTPAGPGQSPSTGEVAVHPFHGRCFTTALFASVIALPKNAPECAGVHEFSVSIDV
jgi:hypothetical protein